MPQLSHSCREVSHGVGADGVGVKFPIFAVNCCCLPLSFRRSREKRRKRGKMRKKRGNMRRQKRENRSDPIYTNPMKNLPKLARNNSMHGGQAAHHSWCLSRSLPAGGPKGLKLSSRSATAHRDACLLTSSQHPSKSKSPSHPDLHCQDACV